MKIYIKLIINILLLIDLSSCARPQLVQKDIDNNVDASFLGIDFNQFLEHIDHDEIQKIEGCCWGIKRQGELLIVLYDKKGLSDLIVRNVEIFSPEISFIEQIRTGMAIDHILKVFPNIELMIDENDYTTEYLSHPALMSYKQDGSLDTVAVFEVESESGNALSINGDYPTRIFSKKGYISKISVFKWQ